MASVNTATQSETQTMNTNSSDLKRKRSPSNDAMHPAPLPKAAKTSNHLQINYLARHCDDDLPLITNDDTLPNILTLLSDYQGVLDRHESMACNLGARPLGPILIKRFERLFDGPPRVLKSHGKDGTTVTWLDVVEFARNKPEQFTLGQMSEGVRVCQFYTKQCRVQISEEDFVLISSGIPQKMIPPQPIIEDEEKELGTLEILERNLGQICQLADQVAARTRQLNHRLKGRKQAILDRRATASPGTAIRASSPSNVALMNGAAQAASSTLASLTQPSQSPSGGFVAVNSRPQTDLNGSSSSSNNHTNSDSPRNGSGASLTTRHELLSKFFTLSDRRPSSQPANGDARRASTGAALTPTAANPASSTTTSKPSLKPTATPLPAATTTTTTTTTPTSTTAAASLPPSTSNLDADLAALLLHSTSPVPIPGTPASLLPTPTPRGAAPAERDDGGPFKTEMVHRMEGLSKGERILPPCDRCRRLHMDCLKNLTACMGCTKKHAKCSWKEVREAEIRALPSGAGGLGLVVGNSAVGGSSETEPEEAGEAASTGSPPPLQQSLTAKEGAGGVRGSPGGFGARIQSPSAREREREREKGVEEQLQEAAAASMAQVRLEGAAGQRERGEVPRAEYQALVA